MEARFRICDLPINTGDSYRVYLVRRSFSASDYTNDAQVTDADAYNYAIGFTVDAKSSTSTVYFTDALCHESVLSSLAPIELNEWTHIAASYSSQTRQLTLYINGEDVSVASQWSPVFTGPGMAITRAGAGYNGMIDEIRFWNDVRTKTEITTWMSQVLKSELVSAEDAEKERRTR